MRVSDILNNLSLMFWNSFLNDSPQVEYKGNSIIPILKNRLSDNQRNNH